MEEVKIGDKTYNLSKLGEEELEELYKFVKEQDEVIIEHIKDPEYKDVEKLIADMNLVKQIRIKLLEAQEVKTQESIRKVLDDSKVSPVDDIDHGFNMTVENLSGAYDKTRGQVQDKKKDIEKEKEELIEELLRTTPRRELTQEDREMVDRILEEYDEKNRRLNTLDNQTNKLVNEQESNMKAMNNEYVQKEIVAENTQNKGLFAKFRNFIDTKLRAKKLKEKVYTDKQNKLTGIINGIKRKIDDAKSKSPVNAKDVKNKLKKAFAIGLAAMTMTTTAPTVFAERTDDSRSSTSNSVEYDMNFDSIEDIAAFAGLVDNGEVIDFEAELDEEKLENLIEIDEAIYQEVNDILGKEKYDLTSEQVRNVLTKFVEVDSLDVSDEAKRDLFLDYMNSNEDGVSYNQIKHIITIYTTKLKIQEQSGAPKKETKPVEKVVEEDQIEEDLLVEDEEAELVVENKDEKTKYDRVVELNKSIDYSLSNAPESVTGNVLKNILKGELTDKEIDKICSSGLSKDEIIKLVKAEILDKYLEDQDVEENPNKESLKKEYEIFDSIMNDAKTYHLFTIDGSMIKGTLVNNLKYINESDLQGVFESGLEFEQIEEIIRGKMAYNYEVSQLTGDAKKAYELIDNIIKTAPSSEWQSILVSNLSQYLPRDIITQIYNECENQKYQDIARWQEYNILGDQSMNFGQSNYNLDYFTDAEGNKYIIGENGEQIFVSDEDLAQLQGMSMNNEEEYEIPVVKDLDTIDREFKSTIEARLKAEAMKLQDHDKDIYNSAYNSIMFYLDPHATLERDRITKEKVDSIPEIQILLKEGIIDKDDINEILSSDAKNYEKVEDLYKLIVSGKEELEADEQTKEAYKFIKDNIKNNPKEFMDKLDDLVPIDAMKEIGILEDNTIEDILKDTNLTDKQKIREIKDVIKDGNKVLEKLGYKDPQKQNEKEQDDFER